MKRGEHEPRRARRPPPTSALERPLARRRSCGTLVGLGASWPSLAGAALRRRRALAVMAIATSAATPGRSAATPADRAVRWPCSALALHACSRPLLAAQARAPGAMGRRGTMMMWLVAPRVRSACSRSLAACCTRGFGRVSSELHRPASSLFVVFSLLIAARASSGGSLPVVPPKAAPRDRQLLAGGSAHARRGSSARDREARRRAIAAASTSQGLAARSTSVQPAEVVHAGVAPLRPGERRGARRSSCRSPQSRRRALARRRMQAQLHARLQGWRVLARAAHASLFLPLLGPLVGALDLPAKAAAARRSAGRHRSAASRRRATAGAATSAIYDAVERLDARARADQPGDRRAEQPGHARRARAERRPRPATLVHQLPRADRPRSRRLDGCRSSARLHDERCSNEGIACVACHQYTGGRAPGAARAHALPGRTSCPARRTSGPSTPVGNAYHRERHRPRSSSSRSSSAQLPQRQLRPQRRRQDREGHRPRAADDLRRVRRSTSPRAARAPASSCHMPVVPGKNRAADGAVVPSSRTTTRRRGRSTTTGSSASTTRSTRSARAIRNATSASALLRSAATLELEPAPPASPSDAVSFKVTHHQRGAGHNLPTGFAFARQMWLEVTVTDGSGARDLHVGRARKHDDDLCDAARSASRQPDDPVRAGLLPARSAARQLPAQARRQDRGAATRTASP